MRLLLIAAGALVLVAVGLFVRGLSQASDGLLGWAVASSLLAVLVLTGWWLGPDNAARRSTAHRR